MPFFNRYKLKIDGNFAPQKENAHERNSWMIEPTWMELRNVKKFNRYKLKIDGNFAPQKENAHERNSWMIEPTWMELRNVKKFD